MTYIAKLLAAVLFFSAITSSPAQASEDGWVEISMCGGQIILLNLGGSSDPADMPKHQNSACHAICDARKDLDDGETT
jgi:hypothetical protein